MNISENAELKLPDSSGPPTIMNDKEKLRRFQELIAQHKGILFKVARTYCREKDDIPDLMQEISIQVWRSVERYDERYKATTWLYRISLNVAISFYRKNTKRRERIIPLNDDISPAVETDSMEKEQQLTLLEQFISELSDLGKALMLLYLEDKSHGEIAEIMGISKSNVGTKISRIKDRLKIRFSQSNL